MTDEDAEISGLLMELASNVDATSARTAVCESVVRGLQELGRMLWVGGYIIGPDRAARASPFDFGSDGMVGLATVAQAGGELGLGAVTLLTSRNLYAAGALMRQVVEIEYLARAFADDHQTARAWLRADGKERRAFWSPDKLRRRAGGRFLPSDYWHHCDLGGHPTPKGMALLPEHQTFDAAFLWVDLAGHLTRVWTDVRRSADQLTPGGVPDNWLPPEVDRAIEHWRAADGLHAAMSDLGALLHGDPESE